MSVKWNENVGIGSSRMGCQQGLEKRSRGVQITSGRQWVVSLPPVKNLRQVKSLSEGKRIGQPHDLLRDAGEGAIVADFLQAGVMGCDEYDVVLGGHAGEALLDARRRVRVAKVSPDLFVQFNVGSLCVRRSVIKMR